MIDFRLLADPLHCPSCAALLPPRPDEGATPHCPACALPLRGPLLDRVWTVSVEAHRLLTLREQLLTTARHEAAVPAAVGQAQPYPSGPARLSAPAAAPDARPHAGPVAAPVAATDPARPRGETPGRLVPRPDWTRRSVQAVLVAMGAALLAVAAAVFLVVSWAHLGVGGRSLVMAGITGTAAAATAWAYRRRLRATAESLAALTLALGLLDVLAVRLVDLWGVQRAAPSVYWAAGTALLAAVTAGGALALPLRAWRYSAAALVMLPLPLLAAYALGTSGPLPAAALLTVHAVLAVAAVRLQVRRPGAADLRVIVEVGGVTGWLAAVLVALIAQEDRAGVLAETGAAGLLLVLGAAAAVHASGLSGVRRWVTGGAGTGAVLAAVLVPALLRVDDVWAPATVAGVALGLVAAAVRLPREHRGGPVAVLGLAALAGVLEIAEELAVVLAGPLGWLGVTWSAPQGALSAPAADLLTPGLLVTTHVAMLVTVVAAGAALALAARAWGGAHPARLVLGASALVALALVAPVAGLAWAPTLAAEGLIGAALVVAGHRLRARGGAHLAVAGALLLVRDLAWSTAVDVATVAALAAALMLLAVLRRRTDARREPLTGRWLEAAATAAALTEVVAVAGLAGAGAALTGLLLAAAAASAGCAWVLLARPGPDEGLRHGGAEVAGVGWLLGTGVAGGQWAEQAALGAAGPVPLALVLAVAAGAAATALLTVLAGDVLLRPYAGAGSVVLLCAAAALQAGHAGASLADAALIAAIVAAVLLPAAGRIGPLLGVDSLPAAVAGALSGAVATLAAADEAQRLWLALLAGGVGWALAAAGPALSGVTRRRLAAVAAGHLLASSWVRLALSDVDVPEAYTLPAAVLLVAGGLLRRRRDPQAGSWAAYGAGLLLALGPSVLLALEPGGGLRPLLLGVGALAVLLAGARSRLQAPVVLGSLALALDVAVQVSPYVLAAYAAVPRWALIGTAGLLLLGLGATAEQRSRELSALAGRVGRLQ